MGHHEPVELAARVWDRLLRLVVSRRLGICRRVRRICTRQKRGIYLTCSDAETSLAGPAQKNQLFSDRKGLMMAHPSSWARRRCW